MLMHRYDVQAQIAMNEQKRRVEAATQLRQEAAQAKQEDLAMQQQIQHALSIAPLLRSFGRHDLDL